MADDRSYWRPAPGSEGVMDEKGFHWDRLGPWFKNVLTGATYSVANAGGPISKLMRESLFYPEELQALEEEYWKAKQDPLVGVRTGEFVGEQMTPEAGMIGAAAAPILGTALPAIGRAIKPNPIAQAAKLAAKGPAKNAIGAAADDFMIWRPGQEPPPIPLDYSVYDQPPNMTPAPAPKSEFGDLITEYQQALMEQRNQMLEGLFPRQSSTSLPDTSKVDATLKRIQYGRGPTPETTVLPRGNEPIVPPYDPSMAPKEPKLLVSGPDWWRKHGGPRNGLPSQDYSDLWYGGPDLYNERWASKYGRVDKPIPGSSFENYAPGGKRRMGLDAEWKAGEEQRKANKIREENLLKEERDDKIRSGYGGPYKGMSYKEAWDKWERDVENWQAAKDDGLYFGDEPKAPDYYLSRPPPTRGTTSTLGEEIQKILDGLQSKRIGSEPKSYFKEDGTPSFWPSSRERYGDPQQVIGRINEGGGHAYRTEHTFGRDPYYEGAGDVTDNILPLDHGAAEPTGLDPLDLSKMEIAPRDLGRGEGVITPPYEGAPIPYRPEGMAKVVNALKDAAENPVNLQSAFRDLDSGIVYRVGPFHDLNAAEKLGMGQNFEDGWAMPDGSFFTRKQAADLMSKWMTDKVK